MKWILLAPGSVAFTHQGQYDVDMSKADYSARFYKHVVPFRGAFRTQGRPSRPGRPQNPPQDEGERVRIDGEAWNQLSRDGQRMFRSFSAADTCVISEFFSKLNLSDKATNAGAVQPFNRHAHLTELDDDDEEDDDPIPATRGSASRIANNDSRMVNTHRISTNFTSLLMRNLTRQTMI